MNSTHSGHTLSTSPCSDDDHAPCLLCHGNSSICPSCQAQLDSRALDYNCMLTPDLPATALYPYTSPLRELVLQVKISGSVKARQALLHLLKRKLHLPRVQVIVPAPASLWGRLRGRHDLAWMLAHQLAKRTGAKLMEAPLFTHWRLHKQSKARQHVPYRLPHLPQKLVRLMLPRLAGQRILLVDDVITSGATMRHLAALFPDNKVSAFAFCLSPSNGLPRRRRAA